MLPRTWTSIFSGLLVLMAVASVSAQDTTKVATNSAPSRREHNPADTIPNRFLPTGIRFGTDLISIIKSQTHSSFNGWEVNGDVDFYRYFLAVDYGKWGITDVLTDGVNTTGTYQDNGSYYRVGVDINFMLKDPDHNMFFLGMRYGHSTYDESMTSSYTDPTYGLVSTTISEQGLHGHWLELTSGLRVKIISGFWLGCTARLKFAPGVSGNSGALKPFDIPGYGLAEHAPWWGFNYQAFWRFPLRKVK